MNILIIKSQRKGMAAIITIVLVMSLLMTFAVTYLKMITIEETVDKQSDFHEKAKDAAYCGISYGMAALQNAGRMIFRDSSVKTRPYFVKFKKDPVSAEQVPPGSFLDIKRDFGNFKESQWIYMPKKEDGSRSKFRIFTYPVTKKIADGLYDYTPNLYMIKSQGVFYVDGESEEDSYDTYKAQFLAQLEIASATKIIYLKRYRLVPYQDDNTFYRYISKLK